MVGMAGMETSIAFLMEIYSLSLDITPMLYTYSVISLNLIPLILVLVPKLASPATMPESDHCSGYDRSIDRCEQTMLVPG